MDWRSSWLKEKKAFVHTIIVFVVSFAILLSGQQVAGAVSDISIILFYSPFVWLDKQISLLAGIANDNRALRAEITDLSMHLQLCSKAVEENKRLREQQGFSPPASYRIVPAEIVGVSGSTIPNSVLIALGADDSIKVNQTIIDRNGVAGRVAQVMNNHSVVYLLTEPRCRVAARVKRSREQGIIRYSAGKEMFLDNLPQQGDIMVGDTVITSGLGGIFAEGLVIGVVRQIESPEKEFFYDISIDPAVNFNGLDELYVLVWEE
jgi:rod shape-determining protein MreC